MLTVIPSQPPHVDLITKLPNGRIYLKFSASPGHYSIEGATNSSFHPGDWTELTNFFTTTNAFEYTDARTNLSLHFYRVKSLSP